MPVSDKISIAEPDTVDATEKFLFSEMAVRAPLIVINAKIYGISSLSKESPFLINIVVIYVIYLNAVFV